MIKNKVLYSFPILLLAASGFATGIATAQEANPTANPQAPVQSSAVSMTAEGMRDDVPIYRIQVV